MARVVLCYVKIQYKIFSLVTANNIGELNKEYQKGNVDQMF